MNYTIYLVEDEKHLASVLRAYLENEGWKITVFHTGEAAIDHIEDPVHLWILDIMLPGLSGYDLIKQIKNQNPNQPVIFISARDQDLDKIMGLELGSDDYLTKPFMPRELVIRVQKLLSRVYNQASKLAILQVSRYQIDINKRKVFENEEAIDLTMKEFDVLLYLLENKNNAKSREAILHAVWGNDYFGSVRAVDDVIRRIRKKMPRLTLETVYGEGYRIIEE